MSSTSKKYDMVVSSGSESESDSSDSDDPTIVHRKKVGTEEAERKATRTEIEQRSRMWQTVGSSDEEDGGGGGGSGGSGKGRDDRAAEDREDRSKDEASDSQSSDSEDEDARSKKSKKSKKEKKSKKSHKHKKEKKSKSEKKKKKKHKKEKRSKSGANAGAVDQDQWGRHGIIQLHDKFRKAREFEAWCNEVKKAPGVVDGPQWEVTEYFKEYMEDYNTSTLPHIKYYDMEAWEKEDYQKQQARNAKKRARTRTEFNDEDAEVEARRHAKKMKEYQRIMETKMLMSTDKDKVEEMKHQKLLITEMQDAYKKGDQSKVKDIEKRLDSTLEDHRWGKYTAPDLNLQAS